MEAITYLDGLVKEYLLFRGFVKTLAAFHTDAKTDPGLGYQAQQICSNLFGVLIPQHRTDEVVSLLKFLQSHVFCKLQEENLRSAADQIETSILRCFIVAAVRNKKLHRVQELCQLEGDTLLTGSNADTWALWLSLPYLNDPEKDYRFQVYFTEEWAKMVEASVHSFLSEALLHLPLPSLLGFDADRQARLALQAKVGQLQEELRSLRAQHADSAADSAPLRPPVSSFHPKTWPDSQPSDVHTQPSAPTTAHAPAQASDPYDSRHRQRGALSSAQPVPAGVRGSQTQLMSHHSAPDLNKQAGDQLSREGSFADAQPAGIRSADSDTALARTPDGHLSPQASGGAVQLAEAVHAPLEAHLSRSEQHSGSATTSRSASLSASLPLSAAGSPPRATPSLLQSHPNSGSFLAGSSHAGPGSTANTSSLHNAVMSSIEGPHEWLEGHEGAIHALAFSADGSNLGSGDAKGVVRIWSPSRPERGNTERAAVLLCGAPVTVLAWDTRTDKVMLVGTVGRGIKAWHADTKRMVSQVRLEASAPDVLALACSPSEPVFACVAGCWVAEGMCSGGASLWNMRTFRKVHALSLPGNRQATGIAYSSDGLCLAAATADFHVCILDAAHRHCTAVLPEWDVTDRRMPQQTLSIPSAPSPHPLPTRASQNQHAVSRPQLAVSPQAAWAAVSLSNQLFRTPFHSHPPLSPGSGGGGKGGGQEAELKLVVQHTAAVSRISWHPSALAVASADVDGRLCLTVL